MPTPFLLVITGPSYDSGKTMLAHRLAANFHLPLLSKDGIKERLFDDLKQPLRQAQAANSRESYKWR